METITIEKVLMFDSIIDSIEYINVGENIKYDIDDDDTHCEATLSLKGKVNTLLGEKNIDEDIDVDIYAPFEKKLDKNDFKIEVKDYSYMINQQKLIIYVILNLHGIKEDVKIDVEDEVEYIEQENINNNEIIDSINNVNEIKEEIRDEEEKKEVLEEKNEKTKVQIVEDNLVEEMNNNWATDLFNLTDNYTLFMKLHID